MKFHKISVATGKKLPDPPADEGWRRYWHGYHQMEKVRSARKKIANKINYNNMREGVHKESFVEKQIFLNIVQQVNRRSISMMELGAGRGDWCLALAGTIVHRLIPCTADRYRCLAVEAEPTHFEWTKQHFEQQHINATAVHGAVCGHDGNCKLYTKADPADHYGQSICDEKGNLEVPCYSISTLCNKYGFNHVDILHMDIQGAEVDAIEGLLPHLGIISIDYLMIGTHKTQETNGCIRRMLYGQYEVLADIPPRVGDVMTDFGKAFFPVDGMLVFKKMRL
jgi:FkbM family methyltransferase